MCKNVQDNQGVFTKMSQRKIEQGKIIKQTTIQKNTKHLTETRD